METTERDVVCTCARPDYTCLAGGKRRCKKCGLYDEVYKGDVKVLNVQATHEVFPDIYEQFGPDFTMHLRRRGGCMVFVAGNVSGPPRYQGTNVRTMLVEVPSGWYLRAACRQRNCIEPDHMEISINAAFSEGHTPKVLTPKMHRVRSYRQFEREFLEV